MTTERLTAEREKWLRAGHSGCSASCEVNEIFNELDAVRRERDEARDKLFTGTDVYQTAIAELHRELAEARRMTTTNVIRLGPADPDLLDEIADDYRDDVSRVCAMGQCRACGAVTTSMAYTHCHACKEIRLRALAAILRGAAMAKDGDK